MKWTLDRLLNAPWWNVVLFSFLLNYPWEFLQAPLYLSMQEMSHVEGIRRCSLAALGDAAISLFAYGLMALLLQEPGWLVVRDRRRTIGFVGLGVAATVLIEQLATRGDWLSDWQYADAMPTVVGVGIAPLLQWLVLPPAVLWFARRQIAGAAA